MDVLGVGLVLCFVIFVWLLSDCWLYLLLRVWVV